MPSDTAVAVEIISIRNDSTFANSCIHLRYLPCTCLLRPSSSAAQAEVLNPREVPAFIDVTLAFLEHCNWRQVAIAPKQREWNARVESEHD